MKITAGELTIIASNTPRYAVTWLGHGQVTNFRLESIGPPSNYLLLVYADLDGRTVAWPPEHILEIEED